MVGYRRRRFVELSRVPASTAGVFTGVLPVSAVLLSYAILGESFRWAHLAAGVGVLLAILLITRRRPAKEEAASGPPA
ncbi:MAG: DMT family transporter [Actinomycetota bacterium]|nr:DMT family transporter [Actinomycetota bacterium]